LTFQPLAEAFIGRSWYSIISGDYTMGQKCAFPPRCQLSSYSYRRTQIESLLRIHS